MSSPEYRPPRRREAVSSTRSRRQGGAHRKVETKTRPKFSIITFLGEILLIVGMLGMLLAYYEAYWTNRESGKLQEQAATALDDQWQREYVNPREHHTPNLGEAFARIYIPSFGSDFQFALVEGTNDADLEIGPGHYTDTAMPGEKGNFAVAGHRVGKGSPFNDLGNLKTCDALVVETASTWNVYKVMPTDGANRQEASNCFTKSQVDKMTIGRYSSVSGRSITLPQDVSVINPIPGTDAAVDEESESLITLTTCHPQFSNKERMIIHGMLTTSIPKSQGKPVEMIQGA